MLAHVLVVDHSPQILELYELALTDEGYAVTPFLYKDDVVEIARRLQPDLIILDYVTMMGQEGWNALYGLKNEDTTASTPIIVATTAIQIPVALRQYMECKGIVVLKKPFELETLFLCIQHGLEQHHGSTCTYLH